MVDFRITLIYTFSYEIGSIGYPFYPHGTPFQLRALPPGVVSKSTVKDLTFIGQVEGPIVRVFLDIFYQSQSTHTDTSQAPSTRHLLRRHQKHPFPFRNRLSPLRWPLHIIRPHLDMPRTRRITLIVHGRHSIAEGDTDAVLNGTLLWRPIRRLCKHTRTRRRRRSTMTSKTLPVATRKRESPLSERISINFAQIIADFAFSRIRILKL